MMRLVRALRDDRGLAAIEFALIVPVLVGMLLFGIEGWMRVDATAKMHSALQAGARYYESGGTDDTAAANMAMQAWAAAPGDAQVTSVRSCQCGTTPSACTSLCANSNLPSAFINLTAAGTFTGLMHSETLTRTADVRIR